MNSLSYIKSVIVISVLVIFSNQLVLGQNKIKPAFRSPVDFPIRLSGTFAELRSGHFHSGIDIKTYEQIGKKVYAIADGYISRINISSGGYGKALYVTHRNGYTSVFAHLSSYNRTLNNFIIEQQRKNKSYEIDISLEKDKFFYKKGDIIAYTGNTGHSMGPHLHFELRETLSQKPVNPLDFGIKVKDNISPIIYGVKVYSDTEMYYLNEIIDVKNRTNSNYHLEKDTIDVFGDVSFGIQTIDMLDDTPNHDGVYSVKLFVEDTLYFKWEAKKFSFTETRYINSFVDYSEHEMSKRRFMKTKIEPNNNLGMYSYLKNNGVIVIKNNELLNIRYEVTDVFNNSSECNFVVRGGNVNKFNLKKEKISCIPLTWDDAHSLVFDDFEINFLKKSFYDDINFSYFVDNNNEIGEVYHIAKSDIPVQRYFNFSILQNDIPDSLVKKAVWMEIYEKKYFPVKTTLMDKRIVAKTRSFGDYVLMIDTIAPKIEILNPQKIYLNKKNNKISCIISDSLSGIKSYSCYLNNKWVLSAYDDKNDMLTYEFDEFVNKGDNTLIIQVVDEKANYTEKELFFQYK